MVDDSQQGGESNPSENENATQDTLPAAPPMGDIPPAREPNFQDAPPPRPANMQDLAPPQNPQAPDTQDEPAAPPPPEPPAPPAPEPAAPPPPPEPSLDPIRPQQGGNTGIPTPPPPSSGNTPSPEGELPEGTRYAGFWIRVGATILDGAVLGFITGILFLLLNMVGALSLTVFNLFSYLLFPLYYWLMIGSSKRATIGKILCGLEVVKPHDGAGLSKLNALGRTLAYYINLLLFSLPFLVVAFTAKKQGLHDMIAKSVVVRTGRSRFWLALVPCIIIGYGTFYYSIYNAGMGMLMGAISQQSQPATSYNGYDDFSGLEDGPMKGNVGAASPTPQIAPELDGYGGDPFASDLDPQAEGTATDAAQPMADYVPIPDSEALYDTVFGQYQGRELVTASKSTMAGPFGVNLVQGNADAVTIAVMPPEVPQEVQYQDNMAVGLYYVLSAENRNGLDESLISKPQRGEFYSDPATGQEGVAFRFAISDYMQGRVIKGIQGAIVVRLPLSDGSYITKQYPFVLGTAYSAQ